MILAAVGQYRDDAGDLQTVRISSAPYSDDALGPFEPRIVEGSDPEYRSRISFAVWGEQGGHTSYGRLEIINIDGSYDDWIGYQMEGMYWELRYGDPTLPWDDLTLHFRAEVRSVSFDRLDRVVIEFRSASERLRGAVQVNLFSPATPNEDVRDTRMPMIIGVPEHVPTVLLDADHANGERYFVADNFNGTEGPHDSDRDGGCREGLALIPIVPSPPAAGEASLWRHGFDINRSVTLPQTALHPLGPRKRLIPWLDAHFARWENDLPGGEWGYLNVDTPDEHYATRYGDLDALYIETALSGGSYTAVRYPDVLEAGKNYTLRMHMMHVEGLTNRARLGINARGTGLTSLVGQHDVEWDDDIFAAARMRVLEFDFEHTGSAGEQMLEIRFRAHSADTLSRFVCLRIQLLPLEDSGQWPGTQMPPHIMTRAHDLIPYLLLERGQKNMDGLPPDFESGPLHPTQIDYAAIEQVTNEYPNTHLGWWWDDGTTHEDLLNRIMSTYNAAWRFDREDRLTAATLRAPEYFTGDAPIAAPVWHTTGQKMAAGDGPTLTVPAPDGVLPGDLVVVVVLSTAPQDWDEPAVRIDSFATASRVPVEIDAQAGGGWDEMQFVTTTLYRVAGTDEPALYVVQGETGVEVARAIAARVTGADATNPFGVKSQATQATGGHLGAGVESITSDHTLLISIASGHTANSSVVTGPDQPTAISPAEAVGNHFFVAVTAGERQAGDDNRQNFTATGSAPLVATVITLAVNPAMPAEADIFTDRFELASDRLSTSPDHAEGLSDMIGVRRNFRPMGEGEVAEANVSPDMRRRYRGEWTRIISANYPDVVDSRYRRAIGAEPLWSMAVGYIMPGSVAQSRLAAYGTPRRWWQYTHLGSDVPAEPGRPGHLTFPRYQLDSGKQLIITDVRHLPLSGHQELICWG